MATLWSATPSTKVHPTWKVVDLYSAASTLGSALVPVNVQTYLVEAGGRDSYMKARALELIAHSARTKRTTDMDGTRGGTTGTCNDFSHGMLWAVMFQWSLPPPLAASTMISQSTPLYAMCKHVLCCGDSPSPEPPWGSGGKSRIPWGSGVDLGSPKIPAGVCQKSHL